MQQTPGQIVSGKTHVDLGQPFSNVQGKGIYISFQWDMIKLDTANAELNGKRVRRLRLMRQPIGDPNTASATYISAEKAAEQYPAEWEYFTKHGDMPVTGTPLSELPGISVSQIQIMQLSGLRSIEDVLGVDEMVVDRIGHEGRFVRSIATEWKAKADEGFEMIDFAEKSAAFSASLASEKARADRAQANVDQLTARLEAMESMIKGSGLTQGVGAPVPPGDANMVGRDEGPDIDSTPNPLAEGTGDIDDYDPLS